jgi:hypothetical protein
MELFIDQKLFSQLKGVLILYVVNGSCTGLKPSEIKIITLEVKQFLIAIILVAAARELRSSCRPLCSAECQMLQSRAGWKRVSELNYVYICTVLNRV